MNRYVDLIGVVRDKRPHHVVEIGTWNGRRASQFMGVSNCYYTGFDLFEEATSTTDKEEFNVKDHHEVVGVGEFLETAGFSKFQLVRGNTNVTLAQTKVEPFDFCFIDGGHSKETITHDYEWARKNVSKGGLIVLDDWYDPPREGLGCNHIEGELFGNKDKVSGGGTVQLLAVDC